MSQTVIGMFDNASEAQQAVNALVNAGFTRDRIDVSTSGSTLGSSSGDYSRDHQSSDEHESGITKFFKNLFGDDDDDSNKYSHVASKSNSIVTVHAQSEDESERAADILDDNGAIDVDEKATQYGYTSGATTGYEGNTGRAMERDITPDFTNSDRISGYSDTDRTSTYTGDDSSYDSSDRNYDKEKKIPIIEENVEIGKRQMNTGGVRLRSRIVERPVEESIRLREERVNIERNSVDRPATDADFANFEETDIEMVERSEVPVVNKQARVVEEISLNKEVEERTETINETVRKTEVDVDNIDRDDR